MSKPTNKTTDTPMLLSVDAATEMLGISKWSTYSLMQSGQLKSLKLGSRRLIARDDLTDCIESLRAASGALHDA